MKAIEDSILGELAERLKHAKASVRAAVEPSFRALKPHHGYVKARYMSLAKSRVQVTTLFVLVNLWMVHRTMLQVA